MSIVPFLSGRAFGPEVTQAMGVAFDAVCRSLAIDNTGTGVVQPRIVARRIIELAQMGVRDPDELRDRALEAFEIGAWRPREERETTSGQPGAK
jgi:hypothetical protein